MKLSTLTIVELVLFNLAFILIYQPRFIFRLFSVKPEFSDLLSKILTSLGAIVICVLFVWSFYFGAVLFIYKKSLLY